MSDYDDGYNDAALGIVDAFREDTDYEYSLGVYAYTHGLMFKINLFDPLGLFDDTPEKTSSNKECKKYSEVVNAVMKWSKAKYEKIFHNKYPALKLVVAVFSYIVANILAILYKIFHIVLLVIILIPSILSVCFCVLFIIFCFEAIWLFIRTLFGI